MNGLTLHQYEMYYIDGKWYNVFNAQPLMLIALILFLLVCIGFGVAYLWNSKEINAAVKDMFRGIFKHKPKSI